MTQPFRIREIQFYERPIHFRMPFRFGVVTLTAEPQIFVRARVEFGNGTLVWGHAADALAPKWFDKNPDRSNEENFADLKRSLSNAASLYLRAGSVPSAFSLFASQYQNLLEAGERQDLPRLVIGFGPALVDRCVADAHCRFHSVSFFEALSANLFGVQALAETPELGRFDMKAFLASLRPLRSLHARHTVGLLDPITAQDQTQKINDGLPETLEEVIRVYGNSYFKLKLQGQLDADLNRLSSIASVLDHCRETYFVTLDGNEQYEQLEEILELWTRLGENPQLRRFVSSILLIEQPLKRDRAMQDISALSSRCPVIIDESDADLDSFPTAKRFGYSGVSSKQCKGIYRSILNAARCRAWSDDNASRPWIMTGEDLTIQGGLALQQELALSAALRLTHIERNGHHFVRGLDGASIEEQQTFLSAHPDLYVSEEGWVRVRIEEGSMRLGSLHCPGLGTSVAPDWRTMERLR